jgi:hypothetical protein
MAAHGVVTGGVIQSIAVDTAGAGYSTAIAVYDGVYGHGDLVQGHRHAWVSGYSAPYDSGGTAFDSTCNPGSNVGTWVKDPTTDTARGTPRIGAETTGPYMIVKKWRRIA